MKKLKQIKNKLKDDNLWIEYKNKFKHKSMRLIVSYIILKYKPTASIEELVNIEKKLIKVKKGKGMFCDSFIEVKEITSLDFNWESFGNFMWYVYQTSTYYKDAKKNKKNIYTLENFIEINKIKTKLFFQWLSSIPIDQKEYNLNIRAIMSKVF